MGFMQKNVNIFLLVLVLIVALSLAGSSVYFQKNFDKLTGKQEDTSANLSECRADLENYKFNLNKTLRSLTTTTQDIRRYDELYVTKSTELESTKGTLEETQSTLQETKLTLQEETALKTKYKRDYEDQLEANRDLEEANAILTSQKAQLESQVISYRQQEGDIENCIADFLSDYDAGLTASMKEDVADCSP